MKNTVGNDDDGDDTDDDDNDINNNQQLTLFTFVAETIIS